MTILSKSSGSGRCSAFASSRGAGPLARVSLPSPSILVWGTGSAGEPTFPRLDLLVSILDRGETAMMALEVFAIYVMPFLIIGVAIRFLMKRYAVDLPDVEKQVGPKPRRRFLLGVWRTED